MEDEGYKFKDFSIKRVSLLLAFCAAILWAVFYLKWATRLATLPVAKSPKRIQHYYTTAFQQSYTVFMPEGRCTNSAESDTAI